MSLYKQGQIWYYDFVVDGKRYAGSTGQTLRSKAQRVLDKLKSQRLGDYSLKQMWEQARRYLGKSGKSVPMTEKDVWGHFVSHSMTQASEKRLRSYQREISEFVKWCSGKAETVAEVTQGLATEYMTFVRSEPGAPASKNETLATLRMLFATFDEEHGVIENPFSNIRRLKSEKVSREVFTTDELRRIGENARGWIFDLCITAISTGLREGDICNLQWEDVSDDCSWLHIGRVRKTGKPLDIPVMRGLRERLLEQPRLDTWVFPELHDLYEHTPSKIGHDVKVFLENIGVCGTVKEKEGYLRKVSCKDVHSLRHTFVYLAACNGVPFPVVQAIVGHSSPAMTEIYMNHASLQDRQRFLGSIPEYMVDGATAPAGDAALLEVIRLVQTDAPKEAVLAALDKIVYRS